MTLQSCSDSENLPEEPERISPDRKYPENLNSSGKCKAFFNVDIFLTAAENQDIRTVEFTKSPHDSLGISIAGGVGSPLGDIPIFIAMMNPVGIAAQTQKLKVRDHSALSNVLTTKCWLLIPSR